MNKAEYEATTPYYDLFWQSESAPALSFLMDISTPNQTFIEIGAGTGRYAIPLAISGRKIYAIEPSPGMRHTLLTKAAHEPRVADTLTIIPGDATSFQLPGVQADVAYLLEVYGHFLTRAERISALSNIHRHLKPGGIFLLDGLLSKEQVKDQPRLLVANRSIGKCRYTMDVQINKKCENLCQQTYYYETWFENTLIESITVPIEVALIDYHELREFLTILNFEIISEYANYEKSPLSSGNGPGVLLARRKE
ncbi:MAG: class I SAM-dependent methyltransferase [bacterium]